MIQVKKFKFISSGYPLLNKHSVRPFLLFCIGLFFAMLVSPYRTNAQPDPNCVCAYCNYPCGKGHSSSCPSYIAGSGKETGSRNNFNANAEHRLNRGQTINKKGNDAYSSGNYRSAIAAYKRALWYSPFDETIKKNLADARRALQSENSRPRHPDPPQQTYKPPQQTNKPQQQQANNDRNRAGSGAASAEVIKAEKDLAEANKKIISLQQDLLSVKGMLKMYNQNLRNNSSEFEKWGKTVDVAYNNTLNLSKEYVAQLFMKYNLFGAFDPAIKKGINKELGAFLGSQDFRVQGWIKDELAKRQVKYEYLEKTVSWVNSGGDAASFFTGDPNSDKQCLDALLLINGLFETAKWVDYKDLVNKNGMFRDMAKIKGGVTPADYFTTARIIGETYTDLAAICYSWYSINRLTEDNDMMAQKIGLLSFRMEQEMKQVSCLQECTTSKSSNCMFKCTGKTRLHTPPPFLK